MKYSFDVIYEIDCTVGEAVAAYLDAEHYMFLHRKWMPQYRALSQDGFKIEIEQTWSNGFITTGNRCMTEYVPPARFLNYNLKPIPAWLPSIHHLIRTNTDLRYYPSEDGQHTVSHLRIGLDMPWFFWPFRKSIERRLTRLKIEKDQEDVDMVARRQRIYGRGNLRSYLNKDVFMLHKEAFCAAFGDEVPEFKQAV